MVAISSICLSRKADQIEELFIVEIQKCLESVTILSVCPLRCPRVPFDSPLSACTRTQAFTLNDMLRKRCRLGSSKARYLEAILILQIITLGYGYVFRLDQALHAQIVWAAMREKRIQTNICCARLLEADIVRQFGDWFALHWQ